MARGKRILIGLSLVVSGYLAVCWLLSGGYLSPQRTVPQRPAGLEDAMIGDTPAWVTPAMPDTVVVLAHGFGGDRSHWAGLADSLHDEGIGVVVPAMPGQDASPQPTVGFGPAEA